MVCRFTHCRMMKRVILLFCFNSPVFPGPTRKAESTKPLWTDAARLSSGFSSRCQTITVQAVMEETLQYVNKRTFNDEEHFRIDSEVCCERDHHLYSFTARKG